MVVARGRSAGARRTRPARSPALEITGVTAGVVIRDRIATTMMEIQLRNPSGTRQEAELLVPVPDGAVVRGFAFQGPARSLRPGCCRATRRERLTIASSPRRATRHCSSLPGSTWCARASFRSSRAGRRRSG